MIDDSFLLSLLPILYHLSPSHTGGYTIYVTAHGDHNLTNELRALSDGVNVGQFDLFFRIYVEGKGSVVWLPSAISPQAHHVKQSSQ